MVWQKNDWGYFSMVYRRKEYDIIEHIFGLYKEADINAWLIWKGIKKEWHNEEAYNEVVKIIKAGGKVEKIKESFKDTDFDIWFSGIFQQICSEAISEKRVEQIEETKKIRFRVSAIEEQSIKDNMVFYMQPWPDGSFAFYNTMKDLQYYLDISNNIETRESNESKGIFKESIPIRGRLENFITLPLTFVRWIALKEGADAYYKSLCKQQAD